MDKETINFVIISGLIGIFGWVTKTLIDQNKSAQSLFDRVQSQIEKEKNSTIDMERKKHEIELQKVNQELNACQQQHHQELKYKDLEIQSLKERIAPEVFDSYKRSIEQLQEAIKDYESQLKTKGVENERLKQKLSEFRNTVQSFSNLSSQNIQTYTDWASDDTRTVTWLTDHQEQLAATIIQEPSISFPEQAESFKQDMIKCLGWLRRSIYDGDYRPDEVFITTNLPKTAYVKALNVLKEKSRQDLTQQAYESFEVYLNCLIEKIQNYAKS
jgi:DNA repair exonuclease SbcCD ATPase subunit